MWAERFKIRHRGLFNLGATWYAPPRQVLDAAKFAVNFTVHLYNYGFPNNPNKVPLVDWPLWYYGVSSMYGQALAVNHVAPEAIGTDKIDAMSMVAGSVNDIYHIHCYQMQDFVSCWWWRCCCVLLCYR
jgi:hypothetical protein